MRWIKSYSKYQESVIIDLEFRSIDLMESLNIWYDILLNSVSAEELDLFDTLKLNKDDYEPIGNGKLDLDYLCGDGDTNPNQEFIDSLSSISLKKSEVQHTDDYETFLNKPCKFMFIYGSEQNELENPSYIMFQVWHDTDNTWTPVKIYQVNGDVKNFYNKISSKTIEIIEGDENYIYTTSNGNEWTLKNVDKENDVYKRVFRKEDIQELVDDRSVKLNII